MTVSTSHFRYLWKEKKNESQIGNWSSSVKWITLKKMNRFFVMKRTIPTRRLELKHYGLKSLVITSNSCFFYFILTNLYRFRFYFRFISWKASFLFFIDLELDLVFFGGRRKQSRFLKESERNRKFNRNKGQNP